MIRYLFSFLFLSVVLFANLVTYGGMEIECNRECGQIPEDPDAARIEYILEKKVFPSFRNCHPVFFAECDDNNDFSFSAFDVMNWDCTYSAYDWQATNGLYVEDGPRKTYSIRNHSAFLDLANALRDACRFYWYDVHAEKMEIYKSMLCQLQNERKRQEYWSVDVNLNGELEFYESFTGGAYTIKELIPKIKKKIPAIQETLDEYYPRRYEEERELLEEAIRDIDALYRSIFLWCLEHHQSEGIAFHAALEDFIGGDFESAIDQIHWLIDMAEGHNVTDDLLSKLYLLKGQVQSEFGLYAEAIIGLTTAIKKNPSMKEAYFERAAAYFELGEFDRALEDYVVSGYRSNQLEKSTRMGLGVTAGIIKGAGISAIDFIPSMLGTLRGLGGGLWALVTDPVGASGDFVNAAVQCIEYIKLHSTSSMIQDLVPELKELIQNYNHLEDFEKGKLIGHVLGKYGMDIFLAKQGTVMIKAYRDLKKANQLMTLEALATPEKSVAILAEADRRWKRMHVEAFRNGEVKIAKDKQGKHIVGHRNYEDLVARNDNPSILAHPDPDRLIREYAGTGVKDQRALGDLPGIAGYVEIVDFKEFIGYSIDPKTKAKTVTTMGKIHYAKDGVHIVPYSKKINDL